MSEQSTVMIYTDGACIGNPGPGGYGVVLVTEGKRKELSAGYRLTTNNRMELLAVIAGLQALRGQCVVTVVSDSQYVVNGLKQGWAKRWRSRGWMRTSTEPAINADLWDQLLTLYEAHDVTMQWVKGHAGHTENERCDRLSVNAARGTDLAEDHGYLHPTLPTRKATVAE